MGYVPNTPSDRAKMLSEVGASSTSSLFDGIPKEVLLGGELRLPKPLSEADLARELSALSAKNLSVAHRTSFLGAGSYNHFVPAVVNHLVKRSEFYTAYTPYQPEISQGMLQAIYEYQTLICNLTGMDVANASMYDGATASAEAASLACRHTGRGVIVVSDALHPEYRAVIKTYARFAGFRTKEIGTTKGGTTDIEEIKKAVDDSTACFILSQPNFFGCIEEVKGLADIVRSKGALFVVSVDPISLGILTPPGEYGADIVTGEGVSMGSPSSFGGPGLGLFAVKNSLVRLLPGRVVGATVDGEKRKGFVLTLQAREQHIRRERATSNICSNEALMALAATVYLSAMGGRGLRRAAELCIQKANYAKERISGLKGFSLPHSAPTFKEFVVKAPVPVKKINAALLKQDIIGGLDLGRFYPKLRGHMLLCATELTRKEDVDALVLALGKIK